MANCFGFHPQLSVELDMPLNDAQPSIDETAKNDSILKQEDSLSSESDSPPTQEETPHAASLGELSPEPEASASIGEGAAFADFFTKNHSKEGIHPKAACFEGDPLSQDAVGFKVNDRRFWQISEIELEDEPARSQLPTYVQQLKTELEEKNQTLQSYIAAYKKEVVENLEKTKERLERDATLRLEQLRGQLAEPMMEVMDALDRSLSAAAQSSNFEALLQGMKMVHLLMLQKLQEFGLQRIETVGKPFDPKVHEAVAVMPVTEEEKNNIILAEFRPGFTLGERLVRAALVQVGKVQ
jgi:molecular chaperone GrpE